MTEEKSADDLLAEVIAVLNDQPMTTVLGVLKRAQMEAEHRIQVRWTLEEVKAIVTEMQQARKAEAAEEDTP
jgi:hypothetical protein